MFGLVGSTINDNNDGVGGGSDDGFDALETTEWLMRTELDNFVMVSHTRLQDVAALPISPATGEMEDKVEYPRTFPSMRKINDKLEHNRCHMTSAYRLKMECEARRKLARDIQQHEAQQQLLANPVHEPAPAQERPWPKANCKLVPASREHFAEIAEIIRLEAQATDRVPQILDSERVKVEDVAQVADVCRRRFRPFLVAINQPVDMTDSSKWPKEAGEEYAKYMKWRNSQPKERAVVVGFAFITDPKLGFLHKADPGARHVGAIRLVVHPSHRRMLYGSALLDRILVSTALGYSSQLDYEWHPPEDENLVYECPVTHNQRQYSQLYIEVCSIASDADAVWRNEMLSFYEFTMVARFPKMMRTDRGDDSENLDLQFWRYKTSATLRNMSPGQYLVPRKRSGVAA